MDTLTITVSRHSILQDLLHVFSDESIVERSINFRFEDEPAVDYDGVKREVFCNFWQQASMKFLHGNESSMLPRCKGMTKEQVIALGQILGQGYILTGFFPLQLNEAFVEAMLCGEEAVSDERLIGKFLELLPPSKSMQLIKIMESDELEAADAEVIVEWEQLYGIQTLPSKENVKQIITQIAVSEIIELPAYSMQRIHEGMLSSKQTKEFWEKVTVADLRDIYFTQRPSPEKVSSLFTCPQNVFTDEEETAFAFLQRYARECTQRQCEDLLKFCTGSNQIVVKNIQVFFAASEAREPLPRAHTCGPVIEIPVPGYPLYDAFKAAFDALLGSTAAYSFTLA